MEKTPKAAEKGPEVEKRIFNDAESESNAPPSSPPALFGAGNPQLPLGAAATKRQDDPVAPVAPPSQDETLPPQSHPSLRNREDVMRVQNFMANWIADIPVPDDIKTVQDHYTAQYDSLLIENLQHFLMQMHAGLAVKSAQMKRVFIKHSGGFVAWCWG